MLYLYDKQIDTINYFKFNMLTSITKNLGKIEIGLKIGQFVHIVIAQNSHIFFPETKLFVMFVFIHTLIPLTLSTNEIKVLSYMNLLVRT